MPDTTVTFPFLTGAAVLVPWLHGRRLLVSYTHRAGTGGCARLHTALSNSCP